MTREPTDRLRHVAHIGVRALPFSYALRGWEAPTTLVRVELTAAGSEELWTGGRTTRRIGSPALIAANAR